MAVYDLKPMRCVILGIVLALVSACQSTTSNKSFDTTKLAITVQGRLNADVQVDVSQTLTGTARQVIILGFLEVEGPDTFLDGIEHFDDAPVKSAAAFAAISSFNADGKNQKVDLIIAPQYFIKKRTRFMGLYKEITATVTGYGGRITKIGGPLAKPKVQTTTLPDKRDTAPFTAQLEDDKSVE